MGQLHSCHGSMGVNKFGRKLSKQHDHLNPSSGHPTFQALEGNLKSLRPFRHLCYDNKIHFFRNSKREKQRSGHIPILILN